MAQPSVILATASYDHTIRFWEAKSGRCYHTIQYPDSVSTYYWRHEQSYIFFWKIETELSSLAGILHNVCLL